MRYSVEKKMAIAGALLIFLAVILSCGQLSLVDHTFVPLPAFTECSETSSAASSPVSRELLGPMGGLLLLLAVGSLFARPLFGGIIGKPPDLSLSVPASPIRVVSSITNDLQEAFCKGIIHPQIYQ